MEELYNCKQCPAILQYLFCISITEDRTSYTGNKSFACSLLVFFMTLHIL